MPASDLRAIISATTQQSFNSLFEMLIEVRATTTQLVIRYAFNSLFEMRTPPISSYCNTSRLSILYLRCHYVTSTKYLLKTVSIFQFSI